MINSIQDSVLTGDSVPDTADVGFAATLKGVERKRAIPGQAEVALSELKTVHASADANRHSYNSLGEMVEKPLGLRRRMISRPNRNYSSVHLRVQPSRVIDDMAQDSSGVILRVNDIDNLHDNADSSPGGLKTVLPLLARAVEQAHKEREFKIFQNCHLMSTFVACNLEIVFQRDPRTPTVQLLSGTNLDTGSTSIGNTITVGRKGYVFGDRNHHLATVERHGICIETA